MIMAGLRFAGAWLIALGAFHSQAADLRFDVPVRCELGRDCFIQNYFDQDPGPGWKDYACGHLSYDGHTGTDFRLRSRRQMEAGVAVVAAAAGRVVALRDGEPDVPLGERTTALRKDREAGNSVRIDHGGGWETQYSHLQRNSIQVRVGEHVEAGTPLGMIGLSGKTEFPHVDFSVRRDRRPVDPFSPAAGLDCGDMKSALWSTQAKDQIRYRPSGVLNSGFADRILSRREIESDQSFAATLDDMAQAIVFHAEIFGIRKDDTEEVLVTDPHGRIVASRSDKAQRDMAVRRVYLGKRRGKAAWPSGSYAAHYVLRRGEAVVAEISATLSIR